MTKFVPVKDPNTGAVGEVPEDALSYWVDRGFVDVAAELAAAVEPEADTAPSMPAGGSPATATGGASDSTATTSSVDSGSKNV